ncbi:RagB/SusD family nutrient uptake outer membrane protein [Fulvivirga maritima]|uniref:RagB/SusD family nutrient uptake outer membrane protein n=1 Tax=Fulvivirga maritima TaxID=2904247 RepID=UPI001F189A12|nr:RagB/SusD family nutrient uptake outer membrane protein [Fulvivirga maritima]UII25396.1 RagB/SusD family nutrient uptake outer membrane protein [Fulvivirga maritima]
MKKNIVLIMLIITVLAGCDDYVDIRTEGEVVPKRTINYRYLLNYTNKFDKTYRPVDIASDDIDLMNDSQVASLDASDFYRVHLNAYAWADSIYYQDEPDTDLVLMYQALYYSNVIINEVVDSEDGTEAEKMAIRGEALVHRAYALLTLGNIFGPAYDEQTANTDLSIPVFTTPTIDENIKRATVSRLYEVVINDLKEAANAGLPSRNSGRSIAYPSEASAYALLARTYLYMGNYDAALTNAQIALDHQNSLLNLEDYENEAYPNKQFDPELILSKSSNQTYRWAPLVLTLSDELLDLFDDGDLRYSIFTAPATMASTDYTEGRVYYKEFLTGEERNGGPTVPEMMLIKAECLARSNQYEAAMETINELRVHRFRAGEYTPLTATDAEDALRKVLQERRRELMCKGGFVGLI